MYIASYILWKYVGEDNCPALSIPDNGNVSCSEEIISFKAGEICNFTCNSGYELTGSNTRMCENGNWTGNKATCTESK